MQLIKWLTEIVADIIHKWKLRRKSTGNPKPVDRVWIEAERKRVNDALKDKWD